MCEMELKKEISVRCAALYPGCDVAEHGGSWKRMCVELTVRSSLETFQPLKSGGCCMYSFKRRLPEITRSFTITEKAPTFV